MTGKETPQKDGNGHHQGNRGAISVSDDISQRDRETEREREREKEREMSGEEKERLARRDTETRHISISSCTLLPCRAPTQSQINTVFYPSLSTAQLPLALIGPKSAPDSFISSFIRKLNPIHT